MRIIARPAAMAIRVPVDLRNIAIVAHVDHGKTTLVDRLLQQTGTLGERVGEVDRILDRGDLERERGITITSKNTAVRWRDLRINIVDTPGHADFGGEVERVLSMVDSVLLLVDAVEGPMPQTRFVTRKAFEAGLRPIVVVNKVDRQGARPHAVVDEVFELFDRLGADDEQLDFPVVFASAVQGRAGHEPDALAANMTPLLETIAQHAPPPVVDAEGALQLQISSLDYSPYVGVIGIGRITRGTLSRNTAVTVVARDGSERSARVLEVLGHHGLERVPVETASAGDIVAVTGIDDIDISDTLCTPGFAEALPALTVDEPTLVMTFRVNTSPFAGRDGKYLTSRHLRERLLREAKHNVALRVEDTDDPDQFRVSGRGELHLSVLLETMRREGYELAVSRPEVIYREVGGHRQEPFEELIIECDQSDQGAVMEVLGERRAQITELSADSGGRVRVVASIASRGLLGLRAQFMSLTSGSGIMTHAFSHYADIVPGLKGNRSQGVLVSMADGHAVAYALFNLQERGRLMIAPGDAVYEGMVVGLHSRGNDLVVNPLKEKKLTNIRAAGSDENILLTPPTRLSLEQALEFIEDDELVEITPHSIRIRKKLLKEHERRRAASPRAGAS